ncbi:oligosaccharide flippase family protein [Listeria rocourtiae]|uniref:lipopolysaccharide biosynthesis protein n=1 Tax=Listeria rocourtiae TaxID=647910 RepID=UPI001623D33E|nr:oligosaccharide flippase family protein [Listeria rocourtiae]MBC1605057.1 oligosaccharide flippase family protein [Listeria rocourtiae]
MKKVFQSLFLKNLTKVFTGNAVAQLILVGLSPILTRIFTPEDFGIFGTYASLLGIFLVISAFAYEKAIPVEEDRANTRHIVLLCMGISLVWFLSGLVLYVSTGWSVFQWMGVSVSYVVPILFGVGVFAASIQQILSYWSIRNNRYGAISFAKIAQSSVNGVAQIGLASTLTKTGVGLVTGDVLGRIAGATNLFVRFMKQEGFSWQRGKLRLLMKKYRRFPLLGMPSLVLNNLALQLPTLLFVVFFGVTESGQFSLTQRMVGIPIAMITTAVGQVFYGKASELQRENPQALKKVYWKLTSRLFLIFLLPMGLFAILSPMLFTWVFGSNWVMAGVYAQMLTPMFFIQLVVLPVSQILYITGNQSLQLLWDSSRFVLLLVGFFFIYHFQVGMTAAILFFSMTMTVSYVLLFLLGNWGIRRKDTIYANQME